MDELLNYAPCGYLTLDNEGHIHTINETLLDKLNYSFDQLKGKHMNNILSVPARLFFQLYFTPLINVEKQVEEMYISLISSDGKEIPVLINAHQRGNSKSVECVLIPMEKRNEYEDELLIAKKKAETALKEKDKINTELQNTLRTLEDKQEELIALNEQNQKFKHETQKELQLAKKIQETSLTAPIINKDIQIESYYKASSELSGDLYGFYQIDDNRYGIILLDVMGHGISSALVTMSLHSLFQRLITRGVTADIVMKELDKHLHTLFRNDEEAWHYCTAIYLVIDTKKKEVQFVNAGHPPAIWQDTSGKQQELKTKTPPIGTIEGISFESKSFTYKPGCKLLLYTDGVVDPYDASFLHTILKENRNRSLTSLKHELIHTIHQEDINIDDDQCFILVNLD
ncbi:SpoIIE family protein phosphatase [Salirhabdus salicampi]|uniref:SpoIIE family protein phosphatase n=1 Tax=Salirhabdus salicampi TaxID=476102 RepID=UPI0020C443CE|nr:SpoIIE family protein phosphatase [Salirhabdus salicampi]MCP8617268.1 SpoIIE family protein phosphatase [Salirhabdus salicampi]